MGIRGFFSSIRIRIKHSHTWLRNNSVCSYLWVFKNICDMYNMFKINVFYLPRTLCTGFLTSVYFASLQSLHHSALDQVCPYYFFMFLYTSKDRYFLHWSYDSGSLVQNFTLAVNQKASFLFPWAFRGFFCALFTASFSL